ncbi:MAG: MBL fold metallo-hydrolase [Chloroflexi bacterium]|nr:MBL fold metallo-hydrolase [Chloroflexota bacterium]
MAVLSKTFTLGRLSVAALSDGAPMRALGGFFNGVDPAEWTKALGITNPEEPLPFNFGIFLVRGDGHTVLIDTGQGARVRGQFEGGGELLARLRELGVRPEEVDTILHTHLHGDHCGWNVDDDAGGALTFPNAAVWVHQKELDYWTSSASDSNPQSQYSRSRILPAQAADRVQTFDGEKAVHPGMTMIPTPGHTPGHCSVLLVSSGDKLLILGDAAHHPVHLERHDWLPGVDLDPAESTRSRGVVAARAVTENALVTGGHFPILTMGRLRRVGQGYKWEAATE